MSIEKLKHFCLSFVAGANNNAKNICVGAKNFLNSLKTLLLTNCLQKNINYSVSEVRYPLSLNLLLRYQRITTATTLNKNCSRYHFTLYRL